MDPYLQAALEGEAKSEETKGSYCATFNKCIMLTASTDARVLLMGRANTFRKLSEKWPCVATLKKALAIMCSIVRANPDIVPAGIKTYWRERLNEANRVISTQTPNAVAEVDYDNILAKVMDLMEQGNEHATLKASQEVVLLALYAFLPPKRADFGNLRIVQDAGELTADENGLVLPTGGDCKLVLNHYKTAKTYKQFVEPLPEELAAIVRASLASFPRNILLVGPRNKPLSDASYSMRVGNVMDKHLGRRLCITDLRNMFIKQKAARGSDCQRKAISKSMMCAL
jgi:hypothetical protein